MYLPPCDPTKIICIHLNYDSRRVEFRAPALTEPTYAAIPRRPRRVAAGLPRSPRSTHSPSSPRTQRLMAVDASPIRTGATSTRVEGTRVRPSSIPFRRTFVT